MENQRTFLDVGGTADASRATAKLFADSFAILINIFGGIVRCDRVVDIWMYDTVDDIKTSMN